MPAYMKLGDIKGESTSETFREWFDVLSFSLGASNSAASGGGGAGKVSMQDVHFVKFAGAGSPAVFLACCDGRRFNEARLVITRDADNETTAEYRFSQVAVSSIQVGGSGHEPTTEQISLNFAKIEYKQVVFDHSGAVDRIETMTWIL